MKKVFLIVINLLVYFLLTGCTTYDYKLEDYDIHNNEYYSVFIKQGGETTYFIKGTDVNGDNKLIRAYSKDKLYISQDKANIVTLPDSIVDFVFCGEKNINSSFELLMMTSNNESYVYKKKENSGPYGVYEIIEVNYTFKTKMRNIAYSSVVKNNDQYMFNENIELYSIKTDEFNNTYLQSNNNKIMLLENINVLNSFFMIDYFDSEYSYYPFIIISNETAYFYVVNNEMELIYNNKYEFNDNIIDYNFCCNYNISNIDDLNSYFYIISGNKMYLYNSEGIEIEIINVEDNLINASINFKYNENEGAVLNVDLIYNDLEDKIIKLIRREIAV